MTAMPSQQFRFDGETIGSEEWWRALAHRGLPLKCDVTSDEQTLTFFWRQRADTEIAKVFIEVNSHTPHPVRDIPTEMQRWGKTNVWYWQTRLRNDWCGSYFFLPARPSDLPMPEKLDGRQRRSWWLDLIDRRASADPFNPVRPHNGAWGRPLSGIYPDGIQWLDLQPQSQLQTIAWHSKCLNNQRNVWLYRTDSKKPQKELPLVLLLDGNYWHTQENFLGELDQRTERGEIPHAAYLMIDAVDNEHRGNELPCNNEFWLALQQELLPQVAQTTPITNKSQQTLVAGQSFGGLASVWAALNWPERFGKAFSQSGSFWWPLANEDHFQPASLDSLDSWVSTAIGRSSKIERPQILLEVGLYEPHMHEDNRALRDALKARQFPSSYREVPGGHDWLCWRRTLVDGIVEMLGT
ncbi:enterochelin esterase [Microbulbifer elongatus]|uniref:Enterochelin esterase n=1 Tax=Microbulbifer elongatus TaxID=86173 RepID=A0ABT1P295_9GAMM|nr:enterochelin esterase [Microbulbifer elongatus]MCQ3829109.1 enterochelin esterase [Microbulbifer elongatus]